MVDKPAKKKIGEILIEDGCLTPEDLQKGLEYQKTQGNGMLIGQILIKMGFLTEESLVGAIGKQLEIPYLPLSLYSINTDAAGLMGEEFSRKNMLILFDRDEKYIYVATADPLNETAIEEIKTKTKLKPQIFVSTMSEIYSMQEIIFAASNQDMKKAG